MYLLLDANVMAGYYLPRCIKGQRVRERIQNLFDSVRSGAVDCFLFAPNFCIAEVFSVFMKHSFGAWNQQVGRGRTIDTRVYKSLVDQFQEDIHNGRFIYHYELCRYHILGINLVAPIDHYYKITKSQRYQTRPMGTFDHLIISMGVHLAHIHGPDNVVVVSTDKRLTDILAKCKSNIPQQTIRKLKLDRSEQITGRPFGPEIFPKDINLKYDGNKDLRQVFGQWPLPVIPHKQAYRWTE